MLGGADNSNGELPSYIIGANTSGWNIFGESCSSPVKQQSDLLRLTYAIEAIKAQGWLDVAVTDAEWNIPALLTDYADVSVLLVKKSDLARHFADNGQLTGEITFVVKGVTDTATVAFDTQALLYSADRDAQQLHVADAASIAAILLTPS